MKDLKPIVIDVQQDFSTVDPDWACEACGGTVEELGCLGARQHGRCRSCGLDSSRSTLPVLEDPFPFKPHCVIGTEELPTSPPVKEPSTEGFSKALLDHLSALENISITGIDRRPFSIEESLKGLDPELQLLRDEEGDEPFANDWKPRS